MSLITRMRKQAAVYWAPSGLDRFGQPSFAAPVELTVRWEDRVGEFRDPQGELVSYTTIVYVGQDVLLGGRFLLGDMTSAISASEPSDNVGAQEIKAFSKVPNIRATEFLRQAYLS